MKFEITFYIQGEKVKSKTTKTKFDYNWYEKTLDKLSKKYIQDGYKLISELEGGLYGYNVYFNERKCISICISHTRCKYLDYKDYNNNHIIEGEYYKSLVNGDIYSFNESPFKKNKIYLRNDSRWEPYVIDNGDGHPYMSDVVKDTFDYNQEFIDSLQLIKKETY